MSSFKSLIICVLVTILFSTSFIHAQCPSADLTQDCIVDMADLAVLCQHWLGTTGVANLNNDSIINEEDFALLADQWQVHGIPTPLTVESYLPKSGDYYLATTDYVSLYGVCDPVLTRSLVANGLLAELSAIDGSWKIGKGGPVLEESIVQPGSQWRYLDDGSDQGAAWYGMDYDDSSWKGPQATELGYGDGDETSPTVGYIDVEPSVSGTQKNVTTYFRHEFNVDDPTKYESLNMGIVRDDGAVVYLNGNELWRTNMPDGTITYTTGAGPSTIGGSDEETFYTYTFDPELLNVGRNVLAVEVHQVKNSSGYVTSSDISFNLELIGMLPEIPDTTGVPVNPGITQITVQAYDGPEGTGNEIDRATINIWRNDSSLTELMGTLSEDTILAAASSPYNVIGDLTVPAGITLTIEPGTTIFFNSGTGITINGRIVAEGTDAAHIRMEPNPGNATRWDGLNFSNTMDDNRLVYVDMSYGDAQGDSILVTSSQIVMNSLTFDSTNNSTAFMELRHPYAVIRNCVFPSISGTEPLHGSGLSGDEYLIFDGCTFGTSTGYNDIIDFTGASRPGPICQWYNCFFLGGGDDGPDLDSTDSHIEGCTFTGFHQSGSGDSTSNAIATGDGSEICIVRNLFIDNDHCILHKEDVYTWVQNNTFVDTIIADVSFGEPFRNPPRTPGRGTYMDSNIHYNSASLFEHYFDNPEDYGPTGPLYIYRSIIPTEWHSMGSGNLDVDPKFVESDNDYHLQPTSPAKAVGINGLDMGYDVPAGASISGAPAMISNSTEATLMIGGPGIVSYRYRIIDNDIPGSWSDEILLPINANDFPADPDHILGQLNLTGLHDGHTYRVDVLGRNSAGLWQGQTVGIDTGFTAPGNPEGNSSATWTVYLLPE